jgi:3',5'-cyclic AMP phosphodiesterase CpdA
MPDNSPTPEAAIRLIHFSDLHVTARPRGWRFEDWFSRRVTGWVNWYVLGRARRFRYADLAAELLVQDIASRRPNHIIFSGDASFLGFENEVARAAQLLRVGDQSSPPGLAIPGNHDLYTPAAARSSAFESHFGVWQQGERIDDEVYPFAQRVGPVWLIGVNSAAPSRWPWDATGRVGQSQLERLQKLLRNLSAGPRILITHYPVQLANGQPETPWHGLRDCAETVRIAADGGVALWLHGHRHGAYHHPSSATCPFPTVCAGSVAQLGRASYMEYEISGNQIRALRRVLDFTERRFCDGELFEIGLKHRDYQRR